MKTQVIPTRLLFDHVADVLNEGKQVTIPTKGVSMLPFIVGGRDSVTLESPHNIHTGDIALALLPSGNYVLHRIRQINGNHIILQGDGNVNQTECCSLSDIKGVAVSIHHSTVTVRCDDAKLQRKVKLWYMMPLRGLLLRILRKWYHYQGFQ